MAIEVRIADIYERISGAQATLGDVSLGYLFLLVLTVIGALFLVIECAALVMGWALAKSITGSVHELFMGTERVRAGDFTHRIRVRYAGSARGARRVVQFHDREHRDAVAAGG